MRRFIGRSLTVSCLVLSGAARAGNDAVVVTNPTPALTATMALTGSDTSCFYWSVTGKVNPAYRGFGANVRLVCQPYSTFGSGSGVTFGGCDGDYCPSNVDACGNFSFPAQVCGSTSPQLDPSIVCTFIVHVDSTKSPQACSSRSVIPDGSPQDPNGSAPCSGGLCPTSP